MRYFVQAYFAAGFAAIAGVFDRVVSTPVARAVDRIRAIPVSRAVDRIRSVQVTRAIDRIRSGPIARFIDRFRSTPIARAFGRVRSAPAARALHETGIYAVAALRPRKHHGQRLLIHEILTLQLVITAIIGALAIAGLYWGGQWVLQDDSVEKLVVEAVIIVAILSMRAF